MNPLTANQMAQAAREAAATTHRPYDPSATFWHGGAPGRHLDELLLPRTRTGYNSGPVHTIDPSIIKSAGLTPDWCPSDLVYVTTVHWIAWHFALKHDGGMIYTVRPYEPITPDPLSTDSWGCHSARVLEMTVAPTLDTLAAKERYAREAWLFDKSRHH